MIVFGLSESKKTARRIAKSLKVKFGKFESAKFPDGEMHLRFGDSVKGKKVVLVKSLNPEPNDGLMELVFAARTAKKLKAKKVYAVIPYLAYMRQDKMFKSGECVSAPEMAKLLNNSVDGLVTVDPHLHRIKKLSEIFRIPTKRVSADPSIAAYIKKKYNKDKTLIVGPDIESSQWAKRIADSIEFESTIFLKERFHSRKVKVRVEKELDWKGKEVIIVDDIVSTGHTMIEAVKEIKKRKAKAVDCVCVHAVMAENAYAKLKKAGARKVLSCDSIKHKSNAIELSKVISEAVKDWK